MKRNEYLDRLREAISFLPEEGRKAAMAFYAEMLDDRIEDGMDEESAVAAMEKPADIAALLKTERAEEIIAASPLHLGARDEKFDFAMLADSALKGIESAMQQPEKTRLHTAAEAAAEWEKEMEAAKEKKEAREKAPAQPEEPETPPEEEKEEKKERSASAPEENRRDTSWEDTVAGALDAAGRALEMAGKTVGKTMEDLFSEQRERAVDQGDYQRRVLTCPASEVRAARLTVSNLPISIRPAEGEDVTLIYYTSQWEPYRAEMRDGVLTLWNEDKDRAKRFGLNFLVNGFKFLWNQKTPTVELLIPSRAFLDLTAHTSNSSIRLEGLKALCEVELKTSNSRISVKHTACMTLDAKTSNSRLVLEDVECKKQLWGKTGNARIAAENVFSGGEMTLATSNGPLEINGARAAGEMALTTSNGSIRAAILDAQSVTLRSSNGNITGAVPGRQADWAISSGTSNGHNSLPRQQAGGKVLSVHTSNGNIRIEFARE